MPTYRFTGSAGFKRMQFQEHTKYEPDGTPYIVRTQLPDEVIPRGELFGPSPEEISAFGDLMTWISDEPFDPPTRASAPPNRLNPELFALVKRAHAGEATADEQQVVGDIVQYLEDHANGTVSADQSAALRLILKDFGMPLFVV